MKKNTWLIIALCIAMLFTLASCGTKEEAKVEPTAAVTEAPTEAPTEVPTEEPTEAPTEVPTEEPTEAPTEVPTEEPTEAPTEVPTEAPTEAPAAAAAPMTWAEYDAAALESEVNLVCYVQAHQSWWDNKVTVYAADKDGAYFLYNMACTEEDAAKLVPGTKIAVKGFKAAWSGEVEVIDATFEFVNDGETFVAEAMDVTELLANADELIKNQNKLVAFKGMTVAASKKADDETEYAFLYAWDGSGTREGNSDLYFNVALGEAVYTFTVESYLCNNTTDVYAAVENLKVGDVVDMEGFLYWYNGVNPHITSVVVK